MKQFECKDEGLNKYLYRICFNDERRHLARTYIGINSKDEVIAYFTLSAGEIEKTELPKHKKPYKSYPVIRLGRFAVNQKHERNNYGTETMTEVFKIYLELSEKLGTIALVVDSYKESVDFYKKFSFEKLLTHDEDTEALYLMTKTLKLGI